MSSAISGLSNTSLQSILTGAVQGTGQSTGITENRVNSIDLSSITQPQDKARLSPFAQMLGELQQLQQTDPDKYKLVTQQISTNLQSAAQTAEAQGDTRAATQLNQLSSDFSSAAKSGDLPDIQDLAKAVGGGRHHHHAHGHVAAKTDSDSDSSSGSSSSASSTTSSSQDQILNQLLSAFANGANPNDALNPMKIIMDSLSSAGVTVPNS